MPNTTPRFFFRNGALCFAITLTLMGCQRKPNSATISSPYGSENQDPKPVEAMAPHFAESQFQEGQWIQWRKVSSTGIQECEKWTVTRKYELIEVLGQFSRDCEKWQENYFETLTFHPATGAIKEDTIYLNQKEYPGVRKTIYERWYGSQANVLFQLNPVKIKDRKFASFRLQELATDFYDRPEHPFHGVALRFSEKSDGLVWRYEFLKSEPDLQEADAL